jgi:LysR family transcriptional regulator, nod-box dependent transcriptional activator
MKCWRKTNYHVEWRCKRRRFFSSPYLLVGTQRIATVPERMAKELARVHPLKLLKPPIEIPGFTMCQAWHKIHRTDAGHRWLREVLLETAKA